MKITKQLELGYADLFSLEPCDSSFRPLRLKRYITAYQDDEVIKKRIAELHMKKDHYSQHFDVEKIEDRAHIFHNEIST